MRRLLTAAALSLTVVAAPAIAAALPHGPRPAAPAGTGAPTAGSATPETATLPLASKFASRCAYSHSGPDDPIVHPSMPGMSHLHDFFGNTTTAADSTLASLRAGTTTCLDPRDTAAYWVPALYVDGQRVLPRAVNTYYLAGLPRRGTVTAFPAGFEAVAGVATGDRVVWSCEGLQDPTPAPRSLTPPTCPAGTDLVLHVRFPGCWNGRDLDSPDHHSHLADAVRGRCPADHPVAVPIVQLNVRYPTRGGTVTLSSGAASTAHADFFNAWDQARLEHLTTVCLDPRLDCRQAVTVR